MKDREDYGTSADRFFNSLDEPMATFAKDLRGIIHKAEPNISEGIKWGIPVYEKDRLVCAIRPGKNYVALQFYTSGTSLRDPDGLLEGTGKKMRHVKIRSKKDIKKNIFTSWIKQAAKAP
jgi:hypothetical protein